MSQPALFALPVEREPFVHTPIPEAISVSQFEWWEEREMVGFLLDLGWWVMVAPNELWLIGRNAGDAFREETFCYGQLAAFAVQQGYMKHRKTPAWKVAKRQFLACDDELHERARQERGFNKWLAALESAVAPPEGLLL